MTDAPLIDAQGIVRRDASSGTTLLHPTTFTLQGGERVALTGPSGSGKSVLLRALALLDPLDGGRVLWRGKAIARQALPRYRSHVAWLRQRPALVDGSVEDNLRFPYSLAIYRGRRFERERAVALLREAGRDTAFLERTASELSGGEAQIVALVRVLQLAPAVLLLDEPTASLDPAAAAAIEALVAAWFAAGERARASVWVSHDPAQAARVGERRLVMQAGRLAAAPAPATS